MNVPSVRSTRPRGSRPAKIRKITLPVSSPHKVPSALRTRMMVLPRLHPSEAAILFCGISVGLTLLLTRGITQYERMADPEFAGGFGMPLAFLWGVLVTYLIGLGCHYLDALLTYSKANKVLELEGSEFYPNKAFRSLFRWLICFAFGPVAVFAFAAHYWIYCGDAGLVDYIILGELIVPSLMYALLGLLVLSDHPRQLFPRPSQVVRMAQRLGWYGVATCACVAVGTSLLVVLGTYAMALVATQLFTGMLLLWICWFGLWECGAVSMRFLGTFFHQTRKRKPRTAARRDDADSVSRPSSFCESDLGDAAESAASAGCRHHAQAHG